MIEIQFKKGIDLYPNSNWVDGKFYNRGRNYRFQAKVYSDPSEVYGINGGCISKLWVKNLDNDKVVFNYDRGYDIGSKSEVSKGYIKELIEHILLHVREIDSQC